LTLSIARCTGDGRINKLTHNVSSNRGAIWAPKKKDNELFAIMKIQGMIVQLVYYNACFQETLKQINSGERKIAPSLRR